MSQRPGFPWRRSGIGRAFASLEDRIFTERRVLFCAIGITIGLAAVLALKIHDGKSVLGPGGRPACIDFCTTWVGGKFAASRVPAKAYDYARFAAAQKALVAEPAPGFPPHRYAYPPVFLFFAYPLALMPYFVAFIVWNVATMALYEAAIYAILPRVSALVAGLAPVAVAENILLGQNGFLTAGLIGLALVFVERRQWLCGILLGLLTYKPQFGVAFPLALLASRRWRAFAAAAASSVALAAAAAAVFGYRTWSLFFAALVNRNASLSAEPGLTITQQSVYGLLHWAVGGVTVPLAIHIAVAIAVALAIGVLWAKPLPHPLKSAALCLAAVTITPYVLIYDLCILSMAAAFLVKDGLARGFLPGERAGLFLCFVGLLFFPVPIGPVICATLFCFVGRRSRVWWNDRLSQPLPHMKAG